MTPSEMRPGGDWMIEHLGLPWPGGTWSSMNGLPRRRLLAYMRLLRSSGVGLNVARGLVAHLYRDALFEWKHRTMKATKRRATRPKRKKKSGA